MRAHKWLNMKKREREKNKTKEEKKGRRKERNSTKTFTKMSHRLVPLLKFIISGAAEP